MRALLDGVLLNLHAILALMARAGLDFASARVSGVAAASPVWLQMLADVLGREVATVTGAEEGGAYGAALPAGVGTGVWSSLEQGLGVIRETGHTRPHAPACAAYDRLYPVHAGLHRLLAPVHAALAEAAGR